MIDVNKATEIISSLTSLPLLPIRPPKEIVFLDGVMLPTKTKGVVIGRAIREFFPQSRSIVVFTPESTEETVIHETLHINGIRSEILIRPLSRILKARLDMRIAESHSVRYVPSKANNEVLMASLNISPGFTGKPNIRYYILHE